ncbi:MAG: transcription-repair coupling factor [Propionibacteriaceae bacterium]|nr:transcription-repair coupling factor [Propionibacteriaceae bacterium]
MTLVGLVAALRDDAALISARQAAAAREPELTITAPEAGTPYVVASLSKARTVLAVTSTYREAEELTAGLGSLLGEPQVAYYPAWETLPHERLSPRLDTVGRRLAVLRRVVSDTPPAVVVAPVRAILQPQAKGLASLRPVRLAKGEDYPMDDLARDLVDAAYARVDLVERRGEFAVRGGIVDIFPPTSDRPVRVDLFGDTVDDIREFGVADQRSTGVELDEVVADPCRELLLTDAVRARAAALADTHPELAELAGKLAEGIVEDGMEALMPALVDGMELLVDLLPPEALVVLVSPEKVAGRAFDLVRTSMEFLNAGWVTAAAGGEAPVDLAASAYRDLDEVREHSLRLGQGWWSVSQFVSGPDTEAVAMEPPVNWRGDAQAAVQAMAEDIRGNKAVVALVEGKGLGARLAEMAADAGLGVRQPDELTTPPAPGVVTIVVADGLSGFRMQHLVVYSSVDIAGQAPTPRSARAMPAKRHNQVVPLELKPGDALVHEIHGIGRFVEMAQRQVQGATREYMVIRYAPSKRGQPGDLLWLPMDQLDLVTRYVGGETPALDRMGGAEWRARKSRARRAVREIAAELIKLYAARQATRGHAFSPDSPWQAEMEDAFPYIATPDQLVAVNDVKHDMEQIVPMDRLICGDVGYGKTEIAVRAAFKAVQDGKQVAILVPTTLLVDQHVATFTARYAGFPVNVAPLSRFQSDREVKATLDGVATGRIDVVIGTHALLGSKVAFKDLGLVVIDEEQRFGVEHKETLKKLRVNVDVLSMSATPIPRTLEMAVTGIREMSTIATPPEERHPVLTFVGGYDEGQVVAAIRRELAREGQVFFVHNRVQSVDKVAARLAELVPEARVVTAHGQMNERALEEIMAGFLARRADVLVSTTIIEAGLDIATANTLIVDHAETMGLSQMHQLRGRVGRSRERGYAYFLYPPEKVLTPTAHDRLNALATNNELGAGMAIAMKDLEIRGAGNLLGAEQSGHIADVGFDLYLRLVGEAVADFRPDGGDTEVEDEPPMRIELPVDAHLPTDYIESERLRLEIYKRIAEIRSEPDIAALRDELVDRYGPVPAPVDALLDVVRFRLLCRSVGLTEVVASGAFVRLSPVGGERGAPLPESRELRLRRLYPGTVIKSPTHLVLVPAPPPGQVLDWATQLVTAAFGNSPP